MDLRKVMIAVRANKSGMASFTKTNETVYSIRYWNGSFEFSHGLTDMISHVYRSSIAFFALLGLLLVSSCTVEARLRELPGLEARVKMYYSAERSKDWEHTYELRTPDFRRTVAREAYISRMRKDSEGWKFIEYEIKSVKKKNDKVYLTIHFIEEPSTDSFYYRSLVKQLPPGTSPPKTFEMDDESIWVQVDGQWYSHGAGTRLHLTMNAPNSSI